MAGLKKLLIIVDWFVPGFKAGGPIQSCVNICIALKNEYDIYVLTTDTDHGETAPYENIISDKWIDNDALGVYIFYMKFKGLKPAHLAAQIAFLDADIIYLNHLFAPLFVVYPLWLKFSGKIRGKVVVSPRGALYDSALSLKSYKKKPMLKVYRWMGIHHQVTFHATNKREQEAIAKYFSGSEIIVADNLPDSNQQAFSTCTKEAGKLNCIFIARIVPIKNLLYLLEILKKISEQVTLTVVGPVENEVYWEECKVAITQMPGNIAVVYLGAKQKDQLAGLIKQQHLFVMPTTGENFGHSIFEALLAGRPVLISDQTPWLNLQEKAAGWDLPLAEPEKFAGVIKDLAHCDQAQFDHYAKSSWQFANHFINNSLAKEQYLKLFQ